MNFFSLDLYTYNLNVSRLSFIKTLLFLKMDSLLAKLRIPKMLVCSVQVVKLNLFESSGLSPPIKI